MIGTVHWSLRKNKDGQIVLFDCIDTAFTYLNPETELFKVINVPMIEDIKEYVELATKTGLHIHIFHILIRVKKIMLRHYLIGANIMRRMEKL